MPRDGSQFRGKDFRANPQNINRSGRPRKMVLTMTKKGYKLSQITDTIQTMVGLTLDEMIKVEKNENSTMLEKVIASSLRKSLEKGSLESIETLLTRVYGKPSQKVDITTDGAKIDNKIQIEVITSGKTSI